MRRPDRMMFLGIAAAACLVPALAAADSIQPLSLQADFGPVAYSERGFGQGMRVGGGVLVRTGRRAAVEVLAEHFSVPVAAGAGGEERLSAGRMEMTALLLQQQFRFLFQGRVQPFVFVGVGFCFIAYVPEKATSGPKVDFVDRLALQWGGGVEYSLFRCVALGARARCNMVRTWVEELPRTHPIRETDSLAENVLNLFGLELSLGLRIAL